MAQVGSLSGGGSPLAEGTEGPEGGGGGVEATGRSAVKNNSVDRKGTQRLRPEDKASRRPLPRAALFALARLLRAL